MSIDPDVVERIVTGAQEEYLDKTIVTDDLIREPNTRTDHECREEYGVESNRFNDVNHSRLITQKVSEIVNCETTKLIEFFDANSGQINQLGHNQFYMDLLGVAANVLSPTHVYLPKRYGYENELRSHNSHDKFNQHPEIPVHWFNPDIFSDKGFLIERGVFFRQLRQGDYTPMPNNVPSSVNFDYSDNRLQVNLGTNAETTVYLRSKFSVGVMDTDSPVIHELALPDPTKI